jgi:hypothetical protein
MCISPFRFLVLVVFLTALFTGRDGLSVPVVPNESIVTGIVKEYAILSSGLIGVRPEQVLYSLTVLVESSEAVGAGPDFLADKKGGSVRFYTKEELSPGLFGKRIKARARYAGDERGGRFWIKEIEIQE